MRLDSKVHRKQEREMQAIVLVAEWGGNPKKAGAFSLESSLSDANESHRY